MPTTSPTARESTTRKPTWAELVAAEPLLAVLLAEIRRIRSKPGFCANSVWFNYRGDYADSYKERMSQLVGWDRKDDPVLGTDRAFDLAYRVLYKALPDCRHSGPFC